MVSVQELTESECCYYSNTNHKGWRHHWILHFSEHTLIHQQFISNFLFVQIIKRYQAPAAYWSCPAVMSLPAPGGREWPVRCFPKGTAGSRASPWCSTSPPTGRRTELHWSTSRRAEIILLSLIKKDPLMLLWQVPNEDAQSTQRSDQRGWGKHIGSKVACLSCSHCRGQDRVGRLHMSRYVWHGLMARDTGR